MNMERKGEWRDYAVAEGEREESLDPWAAS